MEKKIVDIASSNPREDYSLGFSTWSLRVLTDFIMRDLKTVDRISHPKIRNIFLKHKIKYRKSNCFI